MGPKKTAVFDKKTAVLVARSTEKDITGFFEKSAYGKAFSYFFINRRCLANRFVISFVFLMRTEKDIEALTVYYLGNSIHNIPIYKVSFSICFAVSKQAKSFVQKPYYHCEN